MIGCWYCRGERVMSDVNGEHDVYIDCVAETIDVNVDLMNQKYISLIANFCPVCGSDLQKVAEREPVESDMAGGNG